MRDLDSYSGGKSITKQINKTLERKLDDKKSGLNTHGNDIGELIKGDYSPQDIMEYKAKLSETTKHIKKKAKAYAQYVADRYKPQNTPLSEVLKMAVKNKRYLGLDDAQFKYFLYYFELMVKDIYDKDGKYSEGTESLFMRNNTRLRKFFGSDLKDLYYKKKFSSQDMQHLRKFKQMIQSSKRLWGALVNQYREKIKIPECKNKLVKNVTKTDELISEYSVESDVFPMLWALFAGHINHPVYSMLYPDMGTIVYKKIAGKKLSFAPNVSLYKSLDSDPVDIVCDTTSVVEDLLHRYKVQISLWKCMYQINKGVISDKLMNQLQQELDTCNMGRIAQIDETFENFDARGFIAKLYHIFSYNPILTRYISSKYFVTGKALEQGQNFTFQPFLVYRPAIENSFSRRMLKIDESGKIDTSGRTGPTYKIWSVLSAPQYMVMGRGAEVVQQEVATIDTVLTIVVDRSKSNSSLKSIIKAVGERFNQDQSHRIIQSVNSYDTQPVEISTEDSGHPRIALGSSGRSYTSTGYKISGIEETYYLSSVICEKYNPDLGTIEETYSYAFCSDVMGNIKTDKYIDDVKDTDYGKKSAYYDSYHGAKNYQRGDKFTNKFKLVGKTEDEIRDMIKNLITDDIVGKNVSEKVKNSINYQFSVGNYKDLLDALSTIGSDIQDDDKYKKLKNLVLSKVGQYYNSTLPKSSNKTDIIKNSFNVWFASDSRLSYTEKNFNNDDNFKNNNISHGINRMTIKENDAFLAKKQCERFGSVFIYASEDDKHYLDPKYGGFSQ